MNKRTKFQPLSEFQTFLKLGLAGDICIPVNVIGVIKQYGRLRVKIEPVNGSGTATIDKNKLEFAAKDPKGRPLIEKV